MREKLLALIGYLFIFVLFGSLGMYFLHVLLTHPLYLG